MELIWIKRFKLYIIYQNIEIPPQETSIFSFSKLKSSVISVIIPTYNRAGFLEHAMRSVFDQTMPCGELIIVDDGSTDETRHCVDRLSAQAPIPVIFIYQKNRGAAAARNTGIRAARGELISFLDSDDRFVPEKLAIQSRAMGEHPQYLISHTREIWYRHGTILNQKNKHRPSHGKIFEACLKMCVVGMSTILARRELFTRYGMFDESLPCCEDYDLWLRVSAAERFLLIDRPLTLKDGGRRDQLSVIHRMGMDRYRIKAIAHLLDQASLTRRQHRLALAELQRKCGIYGKGCVKHGREEEGGRYLNLPLKYCEL